jgi:hypothetical protein
MKNLDQYGLIYDPTLTWESLAQALEKEVKAERPLTPENLPKDKDGLLCALSQNQARLDEICEAWALTGKWPLMLPVEAWLLQFRLIHGWGLALRLTRKHAHGQTLPVPNRPVALRWLIADSWLQHDLEDLVGSIRPESPSTAPSPHSRR